MSRCKDLTGHRFGLLTVIERAENTSAGRTRWLCRCNCGGVKVAAAADLGKGSTRSCGCLADAVRRKAGQKQCHGYSRSSMPGEYKSWENMLARCYTPSHKSYPRYGGRGIEVCQRWRDSFRAFADDMGPRPAGCSIERIDADVGYTPGNCRWATRTEQANNRENNRVLEFQGETLTVAQWALRLGIPQQRIRSRLNRGWPAHKALSYASLPEGRTG